jgi:hypothetical protein
MKITSFSRNPFQKMLATAAIAIVCAFHANAASITYTNGPASSTDFTINIADILVSDSFTVSTPTLLSSVEVVLGTGLGGVPLSVNWRIGTTFFGKDISFGTGASLSNTFLFTNSGNFDGMYASKFPVFSGVLAPGTYYLTLTHGVNSDSTRSVWDVNNGPSSAELKSGFFGTFPTPSEAFTIFGAAAPTPDSGSTLGLLLLALGGVFGVSRFRSLRAA